MVPGGPAMTDPRPVESAGGSWALRGCLFGSVALFVVLLLVLVYLGYRQFREHTEPVEPTVTYEAPSRDSPSPDRLVPRLAVAPAAAPSPRIHGIAHG